jgi:exonuclease SbcC
LSSLEDALKNEENYEVVNIRSKIEALSRDIRTLDNDKLEAATQYGKVLSDTEKLKIESEERFNLLKEMQVLEMICEAFSKKGLPLVITKSQLPLINDEIAKILNGIVDFTIELENDDETDSTEVYINYGDSKRVIELCSGMEKTVASIAIRVALTNVSSLPKPDMLIIDEGFGTLDEAGVESCNRLLISLKKYFRVILVITHVDGIKDIADTLIEITKNEKDSKVVVV